MKKILKLLCAAGVIWIGMNVYLYFTGNNQHVNKNEVLPYDMNQNDLQYNDDAGDTDETDMAMQTKISADTTVAGNTIVGNTVTGKTELSKHADKGQGDEMDTVSPWNLVLINRWNSLPETFSIELTELMNGHAIDIRVYPELQDMMDDMREEGLLPLICSSYRTDEEQQVLYDNKVNSYLVQGYARTRAEEEAEKWVAAPGTSEHQAGVAVDIVDINYQKLDEEQEHTEVQIWLMEHSWEYGFILRYPSEKSAITGINYEPWHYRYVGKEAAEEIYERGICLEEYLNEKLNE